ncbi:MAG: MFS transporter [Opitutales bacterium]|nr:MFS transporter [Opitutales bacterium]
MTKSDRIPFTEKLSYGFGDLASCLYWQTFMVYLMFFYTDVFGISGKAVGTMLLLARIWDGVNDPLMGAIADRTNTRWGKFRPYFVWMVVPLAIFGWLTFTTPDMGMGGKIAWAYSTYIPLMMLYTAINIPYTALLGVISPNPVDRTTVSSIKFMFAFGAGTLISFFLLPMTKSLGGVKQFYEANKETVDAWLVANPGSKMDAYPEILERTQFGWSMAFAFIGVMVIVFFLITFFGTHERVTPSKNQKTNLKLDFKDLLGNAPWWLLVGTTITYIMFTAIRSTCSAHYFKYFVGEQNVTWLFFGDNWMPYIGTKAMEFEGIVSLFNGVGQIASIVGVLILPLLVSIIGKKKSFYVLMSTAIVGTASYYFFKPEQVSIMLVLQVIGSLGGGTIAALLWAMYADTADYSDWKRGRRATGLVFSASTMTQKYGWAFAALFVGWMLDWSGYVANTEPNETVKSNLTLMMSLIPAVFGVISMVVVSFYPLNDKKVAEIEADLKARKAAEDAEEAASA